MSQTSQEPVFTPTGVFYKTTELPKPTEKNHKDLGLSEKELISMFRLMYLQRRFEERAAQSYQKGKFGGFCHLYIGQEAVSTSFQQVLNADDDMVSGYRIHGIGLARGISAKACMAELYGKATGCVHGKGGSMHFFDAERHFWGGHGIVGGQIPLGAGLAFANKYNNTKRLAVSFFGDGAVDQGSLNESFNLAQLWKLPVIFVVENNGYSMGTAVGRHSAGELHQRALPYGMKHAVLNGLDLFSMIEKLQEVAADIRENSNPWFLEVRTYRYRGHSMSDPQNYRTKDEMDKFKQLDPIEKLRTYIISNKIAEESALEAIEEEVNAEVMDAIDFAEKSPFPDAEDLYRDVYVENDFPFTV